jgi:uroporphyrinogen decarboxylase
MTSRERVWAALSGVAVDRPPVSFWGHVYERESTAADLVEAALEAWRAFHWDWIKLNPRKQYHVEPWGVRYLYPGVARQKPRLTDWPVHEAADWARIGPVPLDAPAFTEQLDAVRLLRRALPADVPIIETVFTPLAVLGEMVEEPQELRAHMGERPELVRRALEAVTASYEPFVAELLRAGADGIYFATVDWASADLMDPAGYREWARPSDLRVLAAAAAARFNVLHVCKGRNLLLQCFTDYPVAAFSWAATDPTNPTLAQALERLPAAVMGGLSQDGALQDRDPAAALAELARARAQTGGRRWLAAPGCSIPPATPEGTLGAVRDAVFAMRGA